MLRRLPTKITHLSARQILTKLTPQTVRLPKPGKLKKLAYGGLALGVGISLVNRYNSIALQSISVKDIKEAKLSPIDAQLLMETEEDLKNKTKSKHQVETLYVGMETAIFIMALIFANSISPLATLVLSLYASKLIYNYMHLATNPVNALSDHFINQSDIIKEINYYYPRLRLNEGGVCYGLTMMWYLYRSIGKDLLTELSNIRDKLSSGKELSQQQHDLLSDIQNVQNYQYCNFVIPHPNWGGIFNKYRFIHLYDVSMAEIISLVLDLVENVTSDTDIKKHIQAWKKQNIENNPEKTIQEVVEQAAHHKNGYSTLMMRSSKGPGHIIGIKSLSNSDRTVLQYFDSNFREAAFGDPRSAQEGILQLLSNAYGNFSQVRKGKLYLQEKRYGFFKDIDANQLYRTNKFNLEAVGNSQRLSSS